MIAAVRGRRGRQALLVLVAVVVGVALAVVRPSLSFGSTENSPDPVTQAARAHARLLVNLSAADAATTLKKLGQGATGAWADQLDAAPASIIAALRTSGARTAGRVDKVAVSQQSATKATVLVAASALVSNAAGAKNVSRSYYFVMTLNRIGGAWKVSSLESAS